MTGEEKKLSIRSFDRRDALAAYEKQGHKCAICGEEFEFEQMHADHITPWSKGGKTTPDNCQMLCRDCNLKKEHRNKLFVQHEVAMNDLSYNLRNVKKKSVS